MRRVSVVGSSGSGKSTLARALAERLGALHVELDAIHHQHGWRSLPDGEFKAAVAEVVAGESWVVDGNYSLVQGQIWERADTVVWVDMPRGLVFRRIVSRSLRRVFGGETLWNGNRERWWNLLMPIPEHNVVLWSTTNFGRVRRRYLAAMQDGRWAQVRFVRLTTPGDVERFLARPDSAVR